MIPLNLLSGLFGRKKASPEASADKTDAPLNPAPERAQSADPPAQARVDAPAPAPDVAPPPKAAGGLFERLRAGLGKSASRLAEGVTAIFTKRKLDDATIEELEELLISADLGVPAAARVASTLARDRFNSDVTDADIKRALAEAVAGVLAPLERPLHVDASRKPHVILMTGVNGSGKTTTIGKLAARWTREGHHVLIAAGDTFRAAAVEQIAAWGQRAGAEIIAQPPGADASGLAFEALQTAKAQGADILLIDTAGRLQNRRELMDELAKIVRVLKKIDATAPHDVLLVLDATVGQNALAQAEAFRSIAGVTGLVMTKLDGTAKGGVLVAIGEKLALPIHYIGVGEGVDDLQPFDAQAFARALAGLDRENA